MEKTNNAADDSKPQMPQNSADSTTRLATASLYLGIFGLGYPSLMYALLIITSPFATQIQDVAGIILMLSYLFLWPLSSVCSVVLGIVALDRVARSQSQTLARQTAELGIFASVSGMIFMVAWMVVPSVLTVRY